MRAVARMEGVFTALGSAATYEAREKLLAHGFLDGDERVVACNTAVGLQHADMLDRDPSGVDPASDEDGSRCEVERHPIAGAAHAGPRASACCVVPGLGPGHCS